jgi:hypothetical protein
VDRDLAWCGSQGERRREVAVALGERGGLG